MKNLLVFAFLAFFAVSISSCSGDSCEGVVCQNEGVATESGKDCNCVCPLAYEGSSCETAINVMVNGNYAGTRTCDGTPSNFSLLLTADANDPLEFEITGSGIYAIGKFITKTDFSLTNVSGSGSFQNGNLSLDYQDYSSGSTVSNCSFSGSK